MFFVIFFFINSKATLNMVQYSNPRPTPLPNCIFKTIVIVFASSLDESLCNVCIFLLFQLSIITKEKKTFYFGSIYEKIIDWVYPLSSPIDSNHSMYFFSSSRKYAYELPIWLTYFFPSQTCENIFFVVQVSNIILIHPTNYMPN